MDLLMRLAIVWAKPMILPRNEYGGGGRDRTDDIMLAKHALSQLSYTPKKIFKPGRPLKKSPGFLSNLGSPRWDRTTDILINSQAFYR